MTRVIAIVEDDPAEADVLRSHFKRFAPDSGEEFDIQRFQDGDAFRSTYQPIYDLVLMDIDLPGINGLATAERLRRVAHSVALVFVTNLAQYAINRYSIPRMARALVWSSLSL